MIENEFKTEYTIKQDSKNIYIKEVSFVLDKINSVANNYILEKQKFFDKLIYKNLDTFTLKQMKSLIEEELTSRE